MILSPFIQTKPPSMDSSEWDHLTEKKPYQEQTGYVISRPDPQMLWLQRKIEVEANRLHTLTDIRIMLDEAPYIDGVCNKFILWATTGKPRLNFTGNSAKKAEQIVTDLLTRIKYTKERASYIYNGLFLECFLKKQISFLPGVENMDPNSLLAALRGGQALGRIDSILGPLQPETVFRNSDFQDKFADNTKAFFQVPEEYSPYPSEYAMYKEWFHQMLILHPRWNHKRQKSHRYSRPALKPVRKAYNRTELSATDAVVQRHLAASRLLVIYLKKHVETGEKPGASADEINTFAEDFLQKYPTGFSKPGEVYIGSGEHEIDSVGDMNLTLSKPADIFMHFEFMSVGLMLNPVLAGFTGGEGGRITGPLLDQLRTNLAMDIEAVNQWEDEEILLPLCYFELFLNGIFDTEITVMHDKPAFLRDIEKKIMASDVQMNALSRQTYYELTAQDKTNRVWADEESRITEELKKFGPADPKVNADVGISGSNADPVKVPVKA